MHNHSRFLRKKWMCWLFEKMVIISSLSIFLSPSASIHEKTEFIVSRNDSSVPWYPLSFQYCSHKSFIILSPSTPPITPDLEGSYISNRRLNFVLKPGIYSFSFCKIFSLSYSSALLILSMNSQNLSVFDVSIATSMFSLAQRRYPMPPI